MPKRTYTATLPDGTPITRTTERTYTNVVVGLDRKGSWRDLGWAGRPDLAEKNASAARGEIYGMSEAALLRSSHDPKVRAQYEARGRQAHGELYRQPVYTDVRILPVEG